MTIAKILPLAFVMIAGPQPHRHLPGHERGVAAKLHGVR